VGGRLSIRESLVPVERLKLPRPHARAHDEHYATLVENYQVRQHVKPGLTGWVRSTAIAAKRSRST